MRHITPIIAVSVILLLAALTELKYTGMQTNEKIEPIRIGAVLPLTGKAADFGAWMLQGLELAKDDINKKGGVNGRMIELYCEDSQGDAKTGVSAYRKLKDINKVKYIFSAVSGVTLAILPEATKDGVVVFTTSTNPSITSGDYLAIRIYLTSKQEAEALAALAYKTLNKRRAGIIYLNDESSNMYSRSFEDKFTGLGGEVFKQAYNSDARDYNSYLTKIKSFNPDVVFISGWKENAIILKEADTLGIKAQYIGTMSFDSPNTVEIAGSSAEGLIFSTPFYNPKSNIPEVQSYVSAYKYKYGDEPSITVAFMYDGLKILADGIGRTQNENAVFKTIISAQYAGVLGNLSFTENGNIIMPVGFVTVKDGAFVAYS